MGGSTENSAFQVTCNPWDLARSPAFQRGAAACWPHAWRRSRSDRYGRFDPRAGRAVRRHRHEAHLWPREPLRLVAFASSLDQIGPLARTAEDAALLLEVLAGHDPLDATSIDRPVPRYTQTVRQPLAGLRLGLVEEHFGAGLDPEVEAATLSAIKVYESLGPRSSVSRCRTASMPWPPTMSSHPRRLEQPGAL